MLFLTCAGAASRHSYHARLCTRVMGLDWLGSMKTSQRQSSRPRVGRPERQSRRLKKMEECAICCHEMVNCCLATTECKHTFHTACLCRVSRYIIRCPLCRAPLWVDSCGDESHVERLSRLAHIDGPSRGTAFVMPRRWSLMLQPHEPDVTVTASSDEEIDEVASAVASSAMSLIEVARGVIEVARPLTG